MDKKNTLTVSLITLFSSAIVHLTFGQSNNEPLDPAGYVTKYEKNFVGIGPKVYVVPAPRTEEELLIDSYDEKGSFSDSITHALRFQQLLSEFKFTSNSNYIQQFYTPFPQTAQSWNDLINREQSEGNQALAVGLFNEYAWLSLNERKTNQTLGLLISALETARKTPAGTDLGIIQQNLTSLYIFSHNYADAAIQQEAFLQQATNNKTVVDQANSWVKIALIQGYLRDYKLAENSIIRKAIPLYNKAKDYAGKILAWENLALIYQMQGKHTEAQWFLLQARDLAVSKNLTGELAEIEYMLAYSKMIQKNYNIAIKEFENAKDLAIKENNQLLQLAIHDHLGNIQIRLDNHKEAKSELEYYWKLRKALF